MDLITIALARKYAGSGSSIPIDDLVPYIGENGNWYIKGEDSGISATGNSNVEVDGILKADTENQNLVVVKDGVETIVGEYTSSIKEEDIVNLFVEEGNVDDN